MAYDQNTRNRLQKFVNEARDLLSVEFTRQFQQKYGLDAGSGEVSELERLVHLNDREMETARMLRDTLAHYLASSPSGDKRECLERMVREQAFTVLNRLCAIRMAEAREIIIESLSRAYNSKGFQLYMHLAGNALGETGDAYRAYLFSLFDELALDLPVLFDRFSPQGRLFPVDKVLRDLLAMMNEPDMEPLWVEDETIGWIYQYFNTQEERRQMRSESQAPRNSRELAVRNQFFTPRYVVEFLTDNTLGRIWYEMTRGKTRLADSCRYLVRRPQEIFLAAGEEAPEMEESAEDLSQEEMLQQPVYIPHRPLKDPRDILMLDPACGSMHFGLYAFDLYEKIYEEAWDLESQLGHQAFERSEDLKPLHQTYTSREELLNDVPRLIVECNIHGVDIDSRAVQIAGLSLWLRAQRSWQYQGLKPQQRPQIRKSNIVCAEPMPGEKAMLEEFVGKLKPLVLGQLVEIIFKKMQLAGEAGSLLKIEEEIEETLNLAREEFRKEILFRNEQRSTLFPDIVPPRQQGVFDFTDLGDKTRFWNFARQKLLDALKEYAEEAENSVAAQTRLFAEDAARGFAFINLFQKRYDVVLMNPPFGDASRATYNNLKLKYPYTYSNLGAVFIEATATILLQNGYIGTIVDIATSVRSSYSEYRKKILYGKYSLMSYVHLGWNVLDANVEVCCFTACTGVVNNNTIPCIDVSNNTDKGQTIQCSCSNVSTNDKFLYWASQEEFESFPNGVPNFTINSELRKLFVRHKSLGGKYANVKTGLSSGDNGRFYSLMWEIPKDNIGKDKRWIFLANGGEFSPFYREFQEVIDWKEKGNIIRTHNGAYVRNESFYYLEGLSYGKRGHFLAIHTHPSERIFTNEGQGIFSSSGKENYYLLGILNSSICRVLINEYCGQHKENGYVQLLPIPSADSKNKATVVCLVEQILTILRKGHRYNLEHLESVGIINMKILSGLKVKPRYLSFLKNKLDELEYNLEATVRQIYNLSDEGDEYVKTKTEQCASLYQAHFQKYENHFYITNEILDQIVGIVLGRWDIRYAIGEKSIHELPDPLAPLPVCPPGMLQNGQGLPASPQDVPDDYPLRISWSGILVDDEGQSEDIVTRVREAIEVIWEEKAGDIEQEACEILGVDSLRDYFRKPGNFFAEHLKRYSKSRRQAPIYWPLSTASGSYTLWLYYHRLTDQTLYRCVNDYVEPKLKQVMESARQLRQKSGRSRQEERELEELVNLEQELQEFQDELLRVAAFWKPDLNDGVQITAAPLWKLFRLTNWRNKLKQAWGKMENGDYDWAHLAYSIWPERVKEKCKNDKSLAIAHDLEDIYEEPVTQARKKGARGKKNT